MNRFVQAASILALAAAASSAAAWYPVPYQSGCMTDEQKQALVDQQKAFAERQQAIAAQYAQAAEQAMIAQRDMAQRMGEQRAAYFAQLQQAAPPQAEQVAAPVAAPVAYQGSAFPEPFPGGPFGPALARPELPAPPAFPAFPEMPAPRFEAPPMPDPSAPGFPEIAMPEPPTFPEMPGLARPAGIAEAPECALDRLPDRLAEIDAYRVQARQELAARRAVMKERSERRRAEHAMRGFGPRSAGYYNGMPSGMGLGGECPKAAPAAPQTQPQAATPVPSQPPVPTQVPATATVAAQQ